MEGRKRNPLKQHSSTQFKKRGGPKRGRQNNHTPEGASENANASDTVYRILCASRRIGSVIGKGGTIIKALREESQAKITVEDSVPGSDERVVIISSPSPKTGKNRSTDDEKNTTSGEGNVSMRPHCAAQDALMKIQEKIIEEDLAWAADEDGDEIEVTTRLLVPNNLVGCILGRKGDVITRLRTEIGADILVLPPESLPACAMDTDELVQVSGEPGLVKRAVYEISTLLHQNPRKGTPPTTYPAARSVQALRYSDFPPGRMVEQGNSFWPRHDHYLNGIPQPTHIGAYENQPSRYRVESFDGVPPSGGGEIPAEFTMKILCLDSKIGGVIGKGGGNVRHLQQETGANIHVEDLSADSDERVIRVSSVEALRDPRSQTIEAILQLQSLTSASSDKGIITTRLLVPSTKVGCIIGQGGLIINDMRRRTKADIRVISKEEKPLCASKDEELVQISGTVGFAHEALAEIASRLRTRFLSNSKGEPAPSRPAPAFGPGVEFPGPRPPPAALDRFHYFEGDVRDYGHPAYLGPPNVRRFPNTTSPTELKIPTSTMSSAIGTGHGNTSELAAPRMTHSEPWLGGHEHGAEMHRPMEHHWSPAPAPRDSYQGFVSSSAQPSHAPQAVPYQTYNNVQQGTAHARYSPSQMHYHQNVNPYEAAPYQSNHPQQVVAYPNNLPQGSSGFDLR
ncbi:hypothetical protein DM860_004875 [Cuscuta australis]|uniref:K Homology domain-containing protein n=1 Tax=Cuscuta australis TaxID=267555 RepID=A0A328DM87_9ASTE|nr:hypothetical protein DM860_004875 [Cuscuta australis]